MSRRRGEIVAIFFDRDGTLCHRSAARDVEFQQWVIERSRFEVVPFSEAQQIIWDEFFASHRCDMVVDVGVEARFWVDYWRRSLDLLGVARSHLDEALERFVFFKFSVIYPGVRQVLTTLMEQGFLLGVISDTFPSLPDSLVYLRLDQFFNVVVDSASVGAGKPSPLIYQYALNLLHLQPKQALFVDDIRDYVVGAQAVGMHALWLDHERSAHDLAHSTIADLYGVLDFLQEGDI